MRFDVDSGDELQGMTPNEIGRLLGRGVNTIREAMASGEIVAFRTSGGHWRATRRAVREYVSRLEVETREAMTTNSK